MELERVSDSQRHIFSVPSKKINDGDDLHFFFTSTAYRDLSKWLLQLNRAVFPRKQPDGTNLILSVGSVTNSSKVIQDLQSLSTKLSDLIQLAPPDTGPRRFGNVAFRKWFQLAEESAAGLVELHLDDVLTGCEDRENLVKELRTYLLGAFGSAQRLDYGTGHELSFLAFLGCLWKLNAFQSGEEAAVVLGVIQPYLNLVRKLIMTYTLEPAGSHGVWGLDDHSFIPYIFGSAQLGPAIPSDSALPTPTEGSLDTAPPPSSVTSKPTVAEYKDSNMYFSAINFIYEVKRGPFWEHSPVLYDVSGITDGWAKINKGMLKMYVAEVLGKFPVVQHFPFGSLFRWEADPDAVHPSSSSSTGHPHARAQPPAMQSRDVPPPAPGRTRASWGTRTGRGGGGGGGGGGGTGGVSLPSRPAPAGTASTRAPWALGNGSASVTARSSQSMAGEQARHLDGMPSTMAPWAKRAAGS